MNKRETKIDILSQITSELRGEVMNCELIEEADINRAWAVQEEIAKELDRRIARLKKERST